MEFPLLCQCECGANIRGRRCANHVCVETLAGLGASILKCTEHSRRRNGVFSTQRTIEHRLEDALNIRRQAENLRMLQEDMDQRKDDLISQFADIAECELTNAFPDLMRHVTFPRRQMKGVFYALRANPELDEYFFLHCVDVPIFEAMISVGQCDSGCLPEYWSFFYEIFKKCRQLLH